MVAMYGSRREGGHVPNSQLRFAGSRPRSGQDRQTPLPRDRRRPLRLQQRSLRVCVHWLQPWHRPTQIPAASWSSFDIGNCVIPQLAVSMLRLPRSLHRVTHALKSQACWLDKARSTNVLRPGSNVLTSCSTFHSFPSWSLQTKHHLHAHVSRSWMTRPWTSVRRMSRPP